MGRKNTAQRLEIDVRRKGEGTARLERVRRHKRFEIFKGTVRGEERKGRVRVPLFCLVRGCSRETRITHELALSQFYTRHVPSKRVVKSTSPPRLLSLPTLCVHSHLSRSRLRFNPDQTQTLRVTLLVELSIPRIEQSSSTLLRPYGPIYLHHPPFSTLEARKLLYFADRRTYRCSLRILTYDIEYDTYVHTKLGKREKNVRIIERNETKRRTEASARVNRCALEGVNCQKLKENRWEGGRI